MKTLKDMISFYKDDDFWTNNFELRQEAIEDIKQIKRENGFWADMAENKIKIAPRGSSRAVIRYIMWKFNLTKEDIQ